MINESKTRKLNIDKIPKEIKEKDCLHIINILKNKIQNEWLRLRNQYENEKLLVIDIFDIW